MVDEHVTRVEKCPQAPAGKGFDEMLSSLVGFSAEIRPYTLFGIPEGRILITCHGGMRWTFP